MDGKEISIPEYVHVEYVEISDANFSRALLLMPDTFPSTFPLHRETSPRRYPIPANVSYACLTLLLPVSYEDQYMPIYEVSYSPWFVDKRQRQMEWWEPQSAQVREALFGWERALATEYRMKLENLVAFARALMNKERDIEVYTTYKGRNVTIGEWSKLNQREGIGRNDKCFCGSGKKFKKCCINKGE